MQVGYTYSQNPLGRIPEGEPLRKIYLKHQVKKKVHFIVWSTLIKFCQQTTITLTSYDLGNLLNQSPYISNGDTILAPFSSSESEPCLVYCFNCLLFFRRSSYLDTSSLVRRAVAPLYIVSCLVAPTGVGWRNCTFVWYYHLMINNAPQFFALMSTMGTFCKGELILFHLRSIMYTYTVELTRA